MSESYRTHPITASITAPANRTSMPPQPLAYFSSVNEPCARIYQGSRNQALGDTSINNAFTKITTPTQAPMLQARMIFILSTHNSSDRSPPLSIWKNKRSNPLLAFRQLWPIERGQNSMHSCGSTPAPVSSRTNSRRPVRRTRT